MKKVRDICKKINLDDLIDKLPGKFSYQVGENAERFSGGQSKEFQLPGHYTEILSFLYLMNLQAILIKKMKKTLGIY